MPDTDEQVALKQRYRESLLRELVDVAGEADRCLRPARIGCGWGESTIGVYRRETREGRDVLGEVPDHPIDASVGVIRVDDLAGDPIAVAFRYSCHPVTMGPRSAVVSSDFPGVARAVVEASLGGLSLFLQGGGGNVNPRAGMGFEVDCRTRSAASAWSSAARSSRWPPASAPTPAVVTAAAGQRGERPLHPVGAGRRAATDELAAAESTVVLDYVDLPEVEGGGRHPGRLAGDLDERRVRGAEDWEQRVAEKYVDWARLLVEAAATDDATCDLFVQAIRVDDLVVTGLNAELFFETGLELRARSPFVTRSHSVHERHDRLSPARRGPPAGGWDVHATYAVPDLIFQVHPHPVALHPGSERRAVEGALSLLARLAS